MHITIGNKLFSNIWFCVSLLGVWFLILFFFSPILYIIIVIDSIEWMCERVCLFPTSFITSLDNMYKAAFLCRYYKYSMYGNGFKDRDRNRYREGWTRTVIDDWESQVNATSHHQTMAWNRMDRILAVMLVVGVRCSGQTES